MSNLKKAYCSSTWYKAGDSSISGKCWRSLLMEPRPMAAMTKSTGSSTCENRPFQSLLEWCTRFSSMAITRCAVRANPLTVELPVRPIRGDEKVWDPDNHRNCLIPGKLRRWAFKVQSFEGVIGKVQVVKLIFCSWKTGIVLKGHLLAFSPRYMLLRSSGILSLEENMSFANTDSDTERRLFTSGSMSSRVNCRNTYENAKGNGMSRRLKKLHKVYFL